MFSGRIQRGSRVRFSIEKQDGEGTVKRVIRLGTREVLTLAYGSVFQLGADNA
jgi:hypothetical protein